MKGCPGDSLSYTEEFMRAELLAPAGSYGSLKAAVMAGADAVYAGGTRFGARAYADNFTEEQLLDAVDYCHLHGSRLYLTVNTLLKDREMEDLYDYLLPYYKKGLDAVIIQDVGVLSYIRKAFPGLDIHASTQMTLCGADGAKLLEASGASRIVTARELSLKEIREIRENTSIEIESFVHGALCYCYSGQCLFSSLIGGRSGNRGRCAQPCRLPYESGRAEGYLLSPKDICTLDILPDILDAGVCSLKIEGRMKRPEYTAGVVRIYRKYLDEVLAHGKKGYRVDQKDRQELMALYNRGGFTTGYYQTHNGREMMSMNRVNHFGTKAAKVLSVKKGSLTIQAAEELHKGDVLENMTVPQEVKRGDTFLLKVHPSSSEGIRPGDILHRTKDEALLSELGRLYMQTERKEKINGKLMISSGQPVILSVNLGKTSVSVKGTLPQPSRNQPLNSEKARKQIEKTGNTPFLFDKLEVQVEEGLFLPMQTLNELRREALDRLTEKLLAARAREERGERPKSPSRKEWQWKGHRLCASAETAGQVTALCGIPQIKRIYLDSSIFGIPISVQKAQSWIELCHKAGKECYYILPHIFRKDAKQKYDDPKSMEALHLFDGILFKNYEEYVFLREKGYDKQMLPDHNVYTFNRYAEEFWKQQGIQKNTAPLELNDRELSRRGCADSEILVYGHLPMMVSAQCVRKNTEKCTGESGILFLKDRKGKRLPVKTNCLFCYNTIYNHVPLSLLGNKKELDALRPDGLRLSFTTESPEETARLARAFAERFVEDREAACDPGDFTRGHFKRGVE